MVTYIAINDECTCNFLLFCTAKEMKNHSETFFQVCFDLFDTKKQDFLSADDLGEIMRAMGFRPTEEELKSLLEEIDEDGSGEIEIGEFCQLCATFLVEDPDMETMKRELKDAFRLKRHSLKG